MDLIYAAEARCPCGAGLAYEKDAGPYGDKAVWDCSAILLDAAIPSGQPGSVQHTGQLPFVFYDIKSEKQPSAGGVTTRPVHA